MKLYNSARWKKLRMMHLRRFPLCTQCLEQGINTPATDVDHIVPHNGNLSLMYDLDNLQSLCRPCSSSRPANPSRTKPKDKIKKDRPSSGWRPNPDRFKQ